MKRHWKKFAIGFAALIVLVLGGSFLYAKVFNKADPAFGQTDVEKRIAAAAASTTLVLTEAEVLTTTITSDPATPEATAAAAAVTTTSAATATPAGAADGTWNIKEGSEVGYRVKESINGFDTTANGRTQVITGTMVASGTTITTGEFTVDMTTFSSDESKRDAQFNGRVMDVETYPTSTFVLTQPIDFGEIPPEGGTVTASATGDLTLHGTTKSVTFDVQGTFQNGLVGVLGQIPVLFADYGIPAPSLGTVTTEDNGLLEFVL
ncbi:MAG: YceI family protein, partial [Ilumatobacteraceae bacterium]